MTEAISLTGYGEIFLSAARNISNQVPGMVTQSLHDCINATPKAGRTIQTLQGGETMDITRLDRFCRATLPMQVFDAIGNNIIESGKEQLFINQATRKPTLSSQVTSLLTNGELNVPAIMGIEHNLAGGTYVGKLEEIARLALYGNTSWEHVDPLSIDRKEPSYSSQVALDCEYDALGPASTVEEFLYRFKDGLANLFTILKSNGLVNEDNAFICAGFGITAQALEATVKFIEQNEKELALFLQDKEIPQGKHHRKRDAYLALIRKLGIIPSDVQRLEELIQENNIEPQLGDQALSAKMGKGLRRRWMGQTLQEIRNLK